MKGGFRNNLLMVRPLSLTLAGFVAATLLVWVSEKNPFLPLSQQRFTTVSTENDAETTYVLSNATYENDNTEDKGLDLVTTEETNSEVEHYGIWPLDSPPTFSSEEQVNQTNVASSSGSEVCNYAKGRWVADNSRPLYSGLQCKQWLSTMWACRQTQRPDFSYEGYRWQPQHCEMPNFERSSLLKRMQNKTIAFVGDSLGRQQFQSLMCMATGGEYSEEVLDVGKEYNLVKPSGAVRPHGWAYRFPQTNTTIIFYWSASLSYLVPFNASDPDSQVAMHLDRPPAFLRNYIHRFTTLVLNTGHHWNKGKLSQNRWVMHVNGKLVEQGSELMKIGKAKSFNINSIVKWVDSQLPSHPELKAFFRTISPRHFSHGEWDSGGSCDNVVPLSGGSEVVRDESSDPLVEGALRGTNVKILDITALSKLRDEAHISRYRNGGALGGSDCLHWCLPGIPDSWNELLIAQL